MEKSRTAASSTTAALRKSPTFRIAATTLSMLLSTSLLMGNAPSAMAMENLDTTDTTLVADSPPGNDAMEVTNSVDTAEPGPKRNRLPSQRLNQNRSQLPIQSRSLHPRPKPEPKSKITPLQLKKT